MVIKTQKNFLLIMSGSLLLALSYFCTGLLGTKLALPPGYATAVFPASGIALFAILWRGYSIWPGILLGSFCMNFWISLQNNPDLTLFQFLPLGLAIGLGASMGALFGAYVFQTFMETKNPLDRVFSLIVFALISAALNGMIAASIGVTSLCIAQVAPWSMFLENWFTWWLGDAIGVLIFTPMLLVLIKLPSIRLKPGQIIEGILLLAFTLIICKGVFGTWFTEISYPLVFLTFPLLIWFAFRLDDFGAMVGIALVFLIATLETIQGNGPFISNRTPHESLLLLQIFLGSITLFTLVFTASLNEKKRIEKALHHLLSEVQILKENKSIQEPSDKPILESPELLQLTPSSKGNLFGIPSLLGLAIILFTLFLWRGVTLQEETSLNQRVGLITDNIKYELVYQIQSQILSLKRMAANWGFHGKPRKEEWINDMKLHIADYPVYQAIGWVDPTFHIRLIFPEEGNEKALNLDLTFEKKRHQTLLRIKESKALAITPPIKLVQGAKGFIIYVPIYFHDSFGGLVSGVFRVKELLDHILTEDLLKNVSLAIYNGQEEIYRKGSTPFPVQGSYLQKADINIYNVNWRLEVWPNSEFINKMQGNNSNLVLFLGFFVALIISLATYFAQKEQFRATQIETAHRKLQTEIERRKQAEKISFLAKEEAEEANHAKSLFLANMSHEIRTPLNAVLGFSQVLLKKNDLAADVKDSIRTIDTSGKNLLTMINEILDISKIEAGKMELNISPFDLKKLVNHVSNLFELRCKEKKLQWNVKGVASSVFVRGDEIKLQQVLINLLGNAVKFTETGEINFSITPLKDNQYQFDIIDTGQGIPIQAQEKVFNAFQQDKGGEKKGGTGLGLAISKKQLQLMGSDLFLKSEIDQGAHFYFTLTLPPAAKDSIVTPNLDNRTILHLSPGHEVKALIVDDIESNRKLLSQLLSNIGVETIFAINGKEGVEKTKEHRPDIIFMDMRMPVMSGEDAIKEIHKEFGRDRFKIVSLTADVVGKNRDYYLSIGCHEYISKPIESNDIYRCIGDLLNVEFIYKEDEVFQEGSTVEKEFDPTQFYVPKDLHSRLIQSAELYNVTELEKNLEEMEQNIEVSGQLVEHLRGLYKAYDFEEILRLVEKVPNTEV